MHKDFRSISFEGITLTPSVMGISVLEPLIPEMSKQTGDWLWRFPICCGVTQSASAVRCYDAATEALNFMLEKRSDVITGIADRFTNSSLSPDQVFSEWNIALRYIQNASADRTDSCKWSATLENSELLQAKANTQKFLKYLDDLLE